MIAGKFLRMRSACARTLDFFMERATVRVTGIEPALSAWESDGSGPLTALT